MQSGAAQLMHCSQHDALQPAAGLLVLCHQKHRRLCLNVACITFVLRDALELRLDGSLALSAPVPSLHTHTDTHTHTHPHTHPHTHTHTHTQLGTRLGLKGLQHLLGALPSWLSYTEREKMTVGRWWCWPLGSRGASSLGVGSSANGAHGPVPGHTFEWRGKPATWVGDCEVTVAGLGDCCLHGAMLLLTVVVL